mmetsp:Transcript_34900/g.48725  ORF Transcript_34900/g.48725 Transcript_34900/m.48725 type:complete len:431 (-) Transcript_34900:130-1422(-)
MATKLAVAFWFLLIHAEIPFCNARFSKKVNGSEWYGAYEAAECLKLCNLREKRPRSYDWRGYVKCLEKWGDLRNVWKVCGEHVEFLSSEASSKLTEEQVAEHARGVAFARQRRIELMYSYPFSTALGTMLFSFRLKMFCLGLSLLVGYFSVIRKWGRGLTWQWQATIAIIAFWYIDLLMGTVHMWLDSPTMLHLPALGEYSEVFQYHHTQPADIYDSFTWPAYMYFFGVEAINALHAIPMCFFLILPLYLTKRLPGVRKTAWIWMFHMSWQTIAAVACHRLAHGDIMEKPFILRFLMHTRILLTPWYHHLHHEVFEVKASGLHLTAFYDSEKGYSWATYNGWATPVLDWITDNYHYTKDGTLNVFLGVLYLPFMILFASSLCALVLSPKSDQWMLMDEEETSIIGEGMNTNDIELKKRKSKVNKWLLKSS